MQSKQHRIHFNIPIAQLLWGIIVFTLWVPQPSFAEVGGNGMDVMNVHPKASTKLMHPGCLNSCHSMGDRPVRENYRRLRLFGRDDELTAN